MSSRIILVAYAAIGGAVGKAVLPELDNMIGGGLITLERAKVIMYRPHELADEEADDWSVDVTGSQPAIRPGDQVPAKEAR